MRILIRLVLVLVLLVVVGLGALAFFLPSIVKSDAVRERIQTAAQSALGREVRYSDLDFGLLPPSLLVLDPSVAGADPDGPPFVQADRVALRVALMPLLSSAVVVDSLVVDSPVVRLRLTKDGIDLPLPPETPDAPETDDAEGAAVNLALHEALLKDAAVMLKDETVSPPVTWRVVKLNASARGDSLDDPIRFDASLELEGGGRVEAAGTATTEGTLDAKVELDAIPLASVKPYVDGLDGLAGALSGTIAIVGPAGAPESLNAKLEVRDTNIATGDVSVRGRLGLEAQVSGDLSAPTASFIADATGADIRYADAFSKPSGTTGRVAGRYTPDRVRDLRAELHNVLATGGVKLGKATRLDLSVEPFELGGWEALLPALAEYRPSGTVRIGDLSVVSEPLSVRGTINLDGVRAQHPDAGAVTLEGAVVAKGDEIQTEGLRLVAADQTITVDANVGDLAGTPRFRFKSQTSQADTNRLVSTFTSSKDTFYGLLDFEGDLSGRAGDDLLKSLRGRSRLDIQDGRIVGLSIFEAVLAAFGSAGQSASGLARIAVNYAALRDPEIQRYFKEDFEELSGTLNIANGVASTDDMRVVYQDYTVNLDGTVGLVDNHFDFGCQVKLSEKLGRTIAKKLGGDAESGRNVILPARLVGQMDQPFERGRNPRVAVKPEAAVAFFSSFYADKYKSKAAEAIDKKLGTGTGKPVLDALEGILGGGRRRQ